MHPAQRLAGQPADVVELGIVGRQRAGRAHDVERIEDAPETVDAALGGLAGLPRARQPLRRRVEALEIAGRRTL